MNCETNSTHKRKTPNDSRLTQVIEVSKELAIRGLVMKGNDLVFYFQSSSNAMKN